MRILIAMGVIGLFGSEERITNHLLDLEKETVAYVASVGSLPALNQEGEKKGDISYIAYVKDPFDVTRPITFVFNGGPGSSSIWLHMGTFGPRRILTPEEGQLPIPPYAIVDNQETILDLTDIVFIDPIGTGFSRGVNGEEARIFYDLEKDIESVGDFIRDYISENKRWNSRKFIAGESYGTLRACGVASYLQSKRGLYLNGLILISCAIDFETLQFGSENSSPLSHVLYLPTYATTAWFHGRGQSGGSLEEVAENAKKFAYKSYAPWILHPQSLSWTEREKLFDELSSMTGIHSQCVKRSNGKIGDFIFLYEFFADQKKMVSLYDSRIVGDYISSHHFIDPSFSLMEGIFVASFHEYLQRELEKNGHYSHFSEEANHQWNFKANDQFMGYPNLLGRLRVAMTSNPFLKIFVGSGYFDLATPFAATEYCFEHLDLPELYMKNIQMELYEGGHMYYLNPQARKKFKGDLETFFINSDKEQHDPLFSDPLSHRQLVRIR